MRGVTSRAPFGFQRSVLIGKRSLFIRMTLNTRRIGPSSEACLLEFKATMRIMAVATFHRAFEYFVMEWLIKVGLNFGMAANAQLWLAKFQKTQG